MDSSFANRPREELKELGRQGGIASGKSKRQKKTIALTFDKILNSPIKEQKYKSVIEQSGLPVGKNPTYKDLLVVMVFGRLLKKATLDDVIKLMTIVGEQCAEIASDDKPLDELLTQIYATAQEMTGNGNIK